MIFPGFIPSSVANYVQPYVVGHGVRLPGSSSGAALLTPGSTGALVIAPESGQGVTVTPGTLADGVVGLALTATLVTTAATFNVGLDAQITSAGSSAQSQFAGRFTLLPGYTGGAPTHGLSLQNQAAGTGTIINYGLAAVTLNTGASTLCIGTTSGFNIGVVGEARNGLVSVGFLGKACTAKDSSANIGVIGNARNAGASSHQLGGYFSLNTSNPTYVSAALMADNGSQTDPIFLARDNGTTVFSVVDGGNIGIGTTAFGASMLGGVSFKNGTAPSGNVADCFQMYAADQTAGNSTLHIRTELGSVIKLYLADTFTQTYATASATNANFTSADLATTAATQTTPWGFASQAQAENIATQFNLLRADVANNKQVINRVIDLLQSLGVAA